jgi:hypothetical protein
MALTEEFSEYRIMHIDTIENKVILGRTCYINRDGDVVSQSLDSHEVSSDNITGLLNDLLIEAKSLV